MTARRLAVALVIAVAAPAAAKPAAPVVHARALEQDSRGSHILVTISAGSKQGLARGWRCRFTSEHGGGTPVDGKVVRVTDSWSVVDIPDAGHGYGDQATCSPPPP